MVKDDERIRKMVKESKREGKTIEEVEKIK
jgi:hypothetical protein